MVKHTLAWSLLAATSLGAIYGMSHAATNATQTFIDAADIATVSIPTQRVRTESGLDFFRFREGKLEWRIQHIYSSQGITPAKKFNIKCYGRTNYYDPIRKELVEEVTNYFSGKLTMLSEDENGYASGSVSLPIRAEEMRYTLKCGLFEKMITVLPSDWQSNSALKKLKSPNNAKEVPSKTVRKATDEIISVSATTGKKTFKLIPGSKNAVVASFVIDVKNKTRINTLTFTSPKWFLETGVLKHMSITIDGREPDSNNITSSKNMLHWSGLADYGLFESVLPGKHRIELKANIINPQNKQAYSDAFTVSGIQGITGAGLKLKLKSSVKLQTYTVPYDKRRTKLQDENLEP